MNDPAQMMNRSYGFWPPQPPPAAVMDDPMVFQNPRPMIFNSGAGPKPGRMSWKGKKPLDKRKKGLPAAGGGDGGAAAGYKPPTLKELQSQNRAKARRFYPKKNFSRFAPFAPRNTTSFIIRAKKSGGIAPLVSPCPVTPAILPTPKFSPSRGGLVDMAKEEWGVDGYGSMKGLIRLRPPGRGGTNAGEDEDEEEGEGSSESDVEEHLEVERRLDHDLSRFEMVYPSFGEEAGAAAYLLENRVDDQDTHIAQLEEENLTLKERIFLMEREMEDLRRRLVLLESEYRAREENNNHSHSHNNADNNNNDDKDGGNENVVAEEEGSENDGGGDVSSEKSVGDYEENNNERQRMVEG